MKISNLFILVCFLVLKVSNCQDCRLFLDDHDRSAMYSRNFISGQSNRWPEKTVPYTLSSSFTSEERDLILSSLSEMSSQTCVRFVERTTQANYVDIYTGENGCFANLGYNGRRGRHVLHLQRPSASSSGTCLVTGIIVHEMEHILGFAHEQNRPDRNQYVRINWENIQSGFASQFWRAQGNDEEGVPNCNTITGNNFDGCHAGFRASTFGVAYDYGSVMHYGLTFFTSNGSPTITLLQSVPQGVTIPNRRGLSQLDIQKTNAAYECQSVEVTSSSTTVVPTTSEQTVPSSTSETTTPFISTSSSATTVPTTPEQTVTSRAPETTTSAATTSSPPTVEPTTPEQTVPSTAPQITTPSNCSDRRKNCHKYLRYCFRSRYMKRNCRSSCGLCECKNIADDDICEQLSSFCNNFRIRTFCRATCNVCTS